VIQRQPFFVCRPTTNIRQNIIADYSADNDKTDKSKNVTLSHKITSVIFKKYCLFFTFIIAQKKYFLRKNRNRQGRNARAQNRNQKLLNTTFWPTTLSLDHIGEYNFFQFGRIIWLVRPFLGTFGSQTANTKKKSSNQAVRDHFELILGTFSYFCFFRRFWLIFFTQ
jgi:hypothetical protein